MKKHVLLGLAAASLLPFIYIAVVSLSMGFTNAVQQASHLWYWILLLAAGFGTQAGLFSFIRQSLRERQRATTFSMGASSGVSAGSMVACCAHHISDMLPILGLAGLATFLANYQTVFILTGVLSNIVGITIMLETIQRHNLCHWVARWNWNMNLVKKRVMLSSGLILAVTVFFRVLNRFVPGS